MGIESIDEKLDQLKSQLRDLSSSYGDKYPEVRKVKDQIARTEAQRTQMLADIKAKGAGAQGTGKQWCRLSRARP